MLAVAGLVVGAPVASAAPPDPVVGDGETRPSVAISVRGDPPDGLVEAVAFELDQAGFEVVTIPTARVSATIYLAATQSGCRIAIDNHVRGVTVDGQTTPDDAALLSVELLVASSVKAAPEPEPEPQPEPPRRRSPEPRPIVPAAKQPGVLRTVADPPRPRTTAWSVGLGLAASSIGLVGVAADLVRDWRRATVGFGLEGAVLPSSTVDVDLAQARKIDAGGLLRGRFAASFIARPGQRVQPTLGAGAELMVPIVHNRYRGEDISEPGTRVDASGLSMGLFFVPTADLGLRIGVGERSALSLGVRTGPRIDIIPIRLVDGTGYRTSRWFVAATVGMRFGVG